MHEWECESLTLKKLNDVIVRWRWRVARVVFNCEVASDEGAVVSVMVKYNPADGRDRRGRDNGGGRDIRSLGAQRLLVENTGGLRILR